MRDLLAQKTVLSDVFDLNDFENPYCVRMKHCTNDICNLDDSDQMALFYGVWDRWWLLDT